MIEAQVIAPWTPDNVMQIALDYFGQLTGVSDDTGQALENLAPSPNHMVALIQCDEATLALIEADANYFVLTSRTLNEAV